MNQKRTTKQALVFSVLSLMLCFCMLIGSTFAWFTDSVSSDKNVIVAGNLDIELEYYKDGAWTTVAGKSDLFNPAAKWEPGHTEVVYLKASNLGNLALKYILSVSIFGETVARNVDGNLFRLSDYLMFDIVADVNPEQNAFADRAAAIAATSNALTLQESTVGNIHDDSIVRGELTPADDQATTDEKYVALVLWMPTEVENEANTMPGTPAPSIDLGVSIVATQAVAEGDSFGTDYDASASAPSSGSGSDILTGFENHIVLEIRGSENEKVSTLLIPESALADADANVTATVTVVDPREGNFDLQVGQTMKSYDLEVTNIAENNNSPVLVRLRIESAGVYVAKEDIIILHNGTQIRSEDIVGYNHNNGYVTFYTTSFSPFDVIYKTSDMPENIVTDATPNPIAILNQAPNYVNTDLDWAEFSGYCPDPSVDPDPMLEAAYIFAADDDADEAAASPFANWFCDFYVSLNTDLGKNQIFLGGNYGEFGWIGFHNGDLTVEANTFVPLLGSVGMQWMYKDIAAIVGEFACGVSDVDGALSGATFTVQLRLINPNDASDIRIVHEVQHTFN